MLGEECRRFPQVLTVSTLIRISWAGCGFHEFSLTLSRCGVFFLRTFPVSPWTEVDFFHLRYQKWQIWKWCPVYHLSSLILTRVLKCILESGANSGSGWLGGPGQTGTRRACNEVGSGNATEWSRNDLRLQNRGIVPVYSKSPSISHCQDLSAPVNQLFKCSSSYVSFCNVGVKGCFFCPVRTT